MRNIDQFHLLNYVTTIYKIYVIMGIWWNMVINDTQRIQNYIFNSLYKKNWW